MHTLRTHLLRTLSVLFIVALWATPAAADEVQLQNGDRITGKVVRLAGGTLTYNTPGGDITIPWNTITSLTSTQTLQVKIANRPGTQTITAMATSGPGQLMLTPGGTVAMTDLTDMSPVEPPVSVTGGANAGFINATGNTDVNSLRMDADLAIREHANRYTASAAINHADDRGEEAARNWTTSFNYDRFLTKRLFINANAIFTNDRFRDLDLRTALGAGLGYQVFDTHVVSLTAKAGFGWVNEDFIVAPDDDYSAFRESVALDIFAVPDRITFFHTHDGYFGLTGDDNLFIKTHTGVRITIVKKFVTTLQWDVDYDASPSPGRAATDRVFSLTFGYRF